MTEKKTPLFNIDNPTLTWSLAAIMAAIIVVLVIFTVSWIQESTDRKPVAAVVNGESIYVEDIALVYDPLPEELKSTYTPEVVLQQSIDKTLVLQDAERLDIRVTDQQVDQRIDQQVASLGTSRTELEAALKTRGKNISEYELAVREELVISTYVDREIAADIIVRDSEINSYYQENIEEFSPAPGQRRIRHLLVETEQEAEAARQRVVNGEEFAAVARDVSIGPTAPQGGLLGYIDEQSPLVEPFLDAALQLNVQEVSQPVQTDFGWHVIYRDLDVVPLREASAQIRDTLSQERVRNAFNTRLTELRKDASIRVYGDISQQLGVEK